MKTKNAHLLKDSSASELDRRNNELSDIFDVSRILNSSLNLTAVLDNLLLVPMGRMMISKSMVALNGTDESSFSIVHLKGLSAEIRNQTFSMQFELKGAHLITQDEAQLKFLWDIGIRLLIPLFSQQRLQGMLAFGHKLTGKPYSEDEQRFLISLANMGAQAIENGRLIGEMIEKKRLEEELNMARNIQQHLLPNDFSSADMIDIHGLNLPSKQVGGDYFDVIHIDNHQTILTIADVSGKGMPAALLMSNLQAGLHLLATEPYELHQITAKLNNLIYHNTSVEKYITFFILKLDTENGKFQYVNAGHNPPLWIRADKKVHLLEDGGLILGMMPDRPYQQGSGCLAAGESIFLYTDGVSEAMDAAGNEFGEQGIIHLTQTQLEQVSSAEFNHKILATLQNFCNGDPTESDDVTLLTIQYGRKK